MAEKNECENFPIRNVYLLWAQCGRVHTPYLHTFSCSRSLICCINFAFCCHSTFRTPQAKQQKSESERFIRISIELHHICGQRNFHSCGFTGRTMRWIFIGNSSSCACWFNIHLTITGFSTQSVNQCGMNDGTSWVPNQRFRYFFSSLFYPARPTSHGNLIIIHQIQWSAKNVPMAAIFSALWKLDFHFWFHFIFILFLLGIFFCHRRTLIKFQVRWFLSNNNSNTNHISIPYTLEHTQLHKQSPKEHCVWWVTSY